MRLPWPFGRRTPSDGPSPAAPEGATPSASSTPTTTPPPTGAWTLLPPIQRTVGDTPLVAPSAPFLDEVPGHRPLPPIVQALGHETGPSAPPGLVLAKSTAVPSLTSGVPMPVQRRTAAASPAAPETWSEPEPVAEVAEAAAPVRHLRTVTPAATVAPPPRPLTRAPTVTSPVAQRSSAPGPRTASPAITSRSPGDPGTGLPPALPASRGAGPGRAGRWAEHAATGAAAPGLGAPLASVPPAAAAPAAPTPGDTPSASPGPGASVSVPGASASFAPPSTAAPAVQRRAGLGDPMTTAPATSVSQRPAMSLPPGRRRMPSAAAGSPGCGAPSVRAVGSGRRTRPPAAANASRLTPCERTGRGQRRATRSRNVVAHHGRPRIAVTIAVAAGGPPHARRSPAPAQRRRPA